MSFYLGCKSFYPSGENIYRYCNPTADRLETAGLNTDDPSRRARIYRAAETIFWHDVPYIPLYERRRIVIRSPDLRNFRLNPSSTPWYHVWNWDI
jgi:ABC-type transport system substrate-binding protein